MNVVGVALGAVLVLACVVTAVADVGRHPAVAGQMAHLGIDPGRAPLLGLAKTAAAAGVITGVWSQSVAIASGGLLVVYFAGAVAAHVRVRDRFAKLAPALGLLWVSALFTLASMAR